MVAPCTLDPLSSCRTSFCKTSSVPWEAHRPHSSQTISSSARVTYIVLNWRRTKRPSKRVAHVRRKIISLGREPWSLQTTMGRESSTTCAARVTPEGLRLRHTSTSVQHSLLRCSGLMWAVRKKVLVDSFVTFAWAMWYDSGISLHCLWWQARLHQCRPQIPTTCFLQLAWINQCGRNAKYQEGF